MDIEKLRRKPRKKLTHEELMVLFKESEEELNKEKEKNEKLAKFIAPSDVYQEDLRRIADTPHGDIHANHKDEDWYVYFLSLSPNELAKVISRRIPRNTQLYYTLLAVDEGAETAQEIRDKYGEYISSAVWGYLVKERYLDKSGVAAKTKYSITSEGREFMEQLNEEVIDTRIMKNER